MAKQKILVVEDEALVAEDISDTITSLGYEVVDVCATGEAAVARAEEGGIDLVLMDILLQGRMDGVEAAERIRQRHGLPIVFLTAHSDDATLNRVKMVGPLGYVLKPFEERELQTAVEIALHRHALERTLKETERRLMTTLKSIGDAVIACDVNGCITFMNPVAEAITGWNRLQAEGRNVAEVCRMIDEQKKTPLESPISRALRTRQVATLETPSLLEDRRGRRIAVDDTAAPILDENGELFGAVLVFKDTSEKREMEQALAESEERFSLAVRGAKDGLWDWNLKTNSIYFSPRWYEMLGCEPAEVSPNPEGWFARVHPDDLDLLKGRIDVHLSGTVPHVECEYRMRHRDDDYRWMLCRGVALADKDGSPYRMAGSQSDITGRKTNDALTGLPNRQFLIDRVQHAIERGRRSEHFRFAVLFLDLDRFKMVNDSLGTSVGDRLLAAVGVRLKNCLRSVDTVSRVGKMLARLRGDEFAILLEDVRGVDDAMVVMRRVQEELARPFEVEEQEVFMSASVGIALSDPEYDLPDDMLRDAAMAMHDAKNAKDASFVVFDGGMHQRAMQRLRVEMDLRRALDREEFVVYYQPIVSLQSGRPVGFEALARWQHPEQGLVSPGVFIPIAEEIGLIVGIGKFVLNDACRQFRLWLDQAPASGLEFVSVNLSAKQFAEEDLVEQVEEAVADAGLEPHHLKLEITETAVMDNAAQAIEVLLRLKQFGTRLSIDDFGTGYSSLAYLNRFPVDTLKIDRSFVMNMTTDEEKLTIVETIIMLASKLNMEIIAEGVETEEQQHLLNRLGSEYAQGFLFSRPVPSAEAGKLLADEVSW